MKGSLQIFHVMAFYQTIIYFHSHIFLVMPRNGLSMKAHCSLMGLHRAVPGWLFAQVMSDTLASITLFIMAIMYCRRVGKDGIQAYFMERRTVRWPSKGSCLLVAKLGEVVSVYWSSICECNHIPMMSYECHGISNHRLFIQLKTHFG